jgi:hypothetical protein
MRSSYKEDVLLLIEEIGRTLCLLEVFSLLIDSVTARFIMSD